MADNLPEEPHELAERLRPLAWDDRMVIRRRLAIQLGDAARAEALFNDALAAVDEVTHLEQLRARLREQIADAERAANAAEETRRKLAGGEVFDAEYEGDTTDLGYYLGEAARALRTAAAVNPCRDEPAAVQS